MSCWNQLGLQDAMTEIALKLVTYHDLTVVTIVALAVGIRYFLVFCSINTVWFKGIKKNEKVEFWWTVLPALWLAMLSYPSLQNLFRMECQGKRRAVTMVEVVGHQWYWSYKYDMLSRSFARFVKHPCYHSRALSPGFGQWGPVEGYRTFKGYSFPIYQFGFDSFMKETGDLKRGEFRLLEVDKRVVTSNGKVLLGITSEDVIHSWCVPSMGVKMDAVPGKHNIAQFTPLKYGVYYGQCTELCGVNHSYMPIVLEVIPEKLFRGWAGKQVRVLNGYPR